MLALTITNRDGEATEVRSEAGFTLMEAIRDAGFDDQFAICGGSLSCATCHVYVEEPHGGVLPSISDDEDDLLSESEHRRPSSRLSCQIQLAESHDGLRATIAPEE